MARSRSVVLSAVLVFALLGCGLAQVLVDDSTMGSGSVDPAVPAGELPLADPQLMYMTGMPVDNQEPVAVPIKFSGADPVTVVDESSEPVALPIKFKGEEENSNYPCAPGVPMVRCLMDPCQPGTCPSGTQCLSNYCGGCNHECVATPVMAEPTDAPTDGPTYQHTTYMPKPTDRPTYGNKPTKGNKGYKTPKSYSGPEECPAGSYLSTSGKKNMCKKCPAGQFTDAINNEHMCHKCEAGTFAARIGSTSCKDCAEGFDSKMGASKCTKVKAPKNNPTYKGGSYKGNNPTYKGPSYKVPKTPPTYKHNTDVTTDNLA